VQAQIYKQKQTKAFLTVPLNAVTTRDKKEGKSLDAGKEKDDSKVESASADDDIEEVIFVVQNGIVRKKPVKNRHSGHQLYPNLARY
jgi:hypothetical protein